MASQLNLSGVPGINFSCDINEQIADNQFEIDEDLVEETFVLENVVNAAPDEDNVVEFDTGIFIEEIRQLPCLWNTSLAVYKDRILHRSECLHGIDFRSCSVKKVNVLINLYILKL
jgi:hypothetical protein